MPLSRFEKCLPWSGAVAGAAWVGHDALARLYSSGEPGRGSVSSITAHPVLNTTSLSFLVVMAVSLIFFATAVRNLLRSGEAGEATWSSVAYGGWLSVAAALAQMAVLRKGLMAAAGDGNRVATEVLSYAEFFGWLGMGAGVSAAFLALGLGGLRTATLPRWFAVTTAVLGVLALLGACSIPPGGLVNYLVLPFWLVGAAVVVARRQARAARGSEPVPAPA